MADMKKHVENHVEKQEEGSEEQLTAFEEKTVSEIRKNLDKINALFTRLLEIVNESLSSTRENVDKNMALSRQKTEEQLNAFRAGSLREISTSFEQIKDTLDEGIKVISRYIDEGNGKTRETLLEAKKESEDRIEAFEAKLIETLEKNENTLLEQLKEAGAQNEKGINDLDKSLRDRVELLESKNDQDILEIRSGLEKLEVVIRETRERFEGEMRDIKDETLRKVSESIAESDRALKEGLDAVSASGSEQTGMIREGFEELRKESQDEYKSLEELVARELSQREEKSGEILNDAISSVEKQVGDIERNLRDRIELLESNQKLEVAELKSAISAVNSDLSVFKESLMSREKIRNGVVVGGIAAMIVLQIISILT